MCGKKEIKIAYFGDHYWSDVYATSTFRYLDNPENLKMMMPGMQMNFAKHEMWDAIAVVEELYLEEPCADKRKLLTNGTDPHLIDMKSYWGESYFYHDNGRRNFFVAHLEKSARYAIPFMRNLKQLIR